MSNRFIELRDALLRTRADLAAAQQGFRWPEFGEFNWVRDYFEVIAAGNAAPALRLVDDAGTDQELSFAELARRAAQLANFLAGHGLQAGDRVLLMLPNCVPLWETMLAAIRLGAVVIPATHAARARRPHRSPRARPGQGRDHRGGADRALCRPRGRAVAHRGRGAHRGLAGLRRLA